MGFYPKHLKVRRHRAIMRLIATAALSGCTFVGAVYETPSGKHNYNGDIIYRRKLGWFIRFPDGKESWVWGSKRVCADVYLAWRLSQIDVVAKRSS